MYCVITADINKSSAVADRGHLQDSILAAIGQVNEKFSDELVVPFSVTIGDEWQGVLRGISHSYSVIDLFRTMLGEYQASFGVGMGGIETAILTESRNMDGAAFHNSRAALNRAKAEKKEIIYLTNDSAIDTPVNTICLLLQVVRSRWTRRQAEKILLYKKLGNETLVAQSLGVTQGDINQAIKAGAGKSYLEAEASLIKYLSEITNS